MKFDNFLTQDGMTPVQICSLAFLDFNLVWKHVKR